ncbi:MAG: glycosyltransferase family 2 protein, partial [Lachnospiraceae bacterium]|nr:glycosyltransferase family 2 protein [Lachnospiraceae bacterium]
MKKIVGGTYKYIKKENVGKHTALNKGLEIAQGEFFVILDSDDWFADTALQKMHDICLSIENDDAFCG